MALSRIIIASLGVLCVASSLARPADARRALSEDELDQTNAGGLEVRVVSDETETAAVGAPNLFVDRLFGQNEVITRVVLEIVTRMDVDFNQSNQIAQTMSAEELEAMLEASRDINMTVRGAANEGAAVAVINNVSGSNQVETLINISVMLPAGQASVRGYSNPFAMSGDSPGAPGGNVASPPVQAGPQFETPTTLGGAASLLQDLARQHPQAAPGLNSGAATIQSPPQ